MAHGRTGYVAHGLKFFDVDVLIQPMAPRRATGYVAHRPSTGKFIGVDVLIQPMDVLRMGYVAHSPSLRSP